MSVIEAVRRMVSTISQEQIDKSLGQQLETDYTKLDSIRPTLYALNTQYLFLQGQIVPINLENFCLELLKLTSRNFFEPLFRATMPQNPQQPIYSYANRSDLLTSATVDNNLALYGISTILMGLSAVMGPEINNVMNTEARKSPANDAAELAGRDFGTSVSSAYQLVTERLPQLFPPTTSLPATLEHPKSALAYLINTKAFHKCPAAGFTAMVYGSFGEYLERPDYRRALIARLAA